MIDEKLNIIIITEGKAGHLSQSRGIAELIDHDKRVRIITVDLKPGAEESLLRGLAGLHCFLGIPSLASLFKRASKHISQEDLEFLESKNPDLIISAGTIPASFSIILKKKFKCRNIVAMRPSMLPLSAFDLAILPEHDIKGDEPSCVIPTTTSPNVCLPNLIHDEGISFAEKFNLSKNGNYHAIFLGGPSKVRTFPSENVLRIVRAIIQNAEKGNCKLIITTSRRTEKTFETELKKLADEFKDNIAFLQIYSEMPQSTTKGILALSKVVYITEDSVSMVSESLWAGRMTFLIELPSKNPGKSDKIERFKNKLADKRMIGVISDTDAFKDEIQYDGSVMLPDIDIIRQHVNRHLRNQV